MSSAYGALDRLGIPGLVRSWRNAAPVLCYHNVVPADHPSALGDKSLHLPVDRFEAQIRWLARQYEIVPLETLTRRIARGESLRRLAAITFDDAYQGVFDYAWPILKARGLPATTFVVTGAAEVGSPFWWDHPETSNSDDHQRAHWLTECHGDSRLVLHDQTPPTLPAYMHAARWPVIAAAAREGMALGAHSMTHRALATLTPRELTFEIVPCRGVIAQRTQVNTRLFSYPYGLFDDRVKEIVRAAGYTAAVAMDPGLNAAGVDPWALRRVNVPASLPAETFAAWTAGLMPPQSLGA